MASVRFKGFIGAFAGSAMFFSSTVAAAASNSPSPQSIAPWAALSLLSGGAPASAVCGAAATAAQAPTSGCVLPVVDAPPPAPVAEAPPAVPLQQAGYGFSPLLAGLVAVAVGVGLFFLVKDHNNNHSRPISPT